MDVDASLLYEMFTIKIWVVLGLYNIQFIITRKVQEAFCGPMISQQPELQ